MYLCEFDVFRVYIISVSSCPCIQVQETDTPGYVKLLQREGAQQTTRCIRRAVVNNVLLPDKLMNKFYGELERCKRKCQEVARACVDLDDEKKELRQIDDRIKLRRHGPAVQMDIQDIKMEVKFNADRQAATSQKFYSVDMVPAIEIPRGNGKCDYYVAKSTKGLSRPRNTWRQSFSLEEKNRLVTADKDNCCRKQVFRVLKVIRNREPGLAPLTSYHLKTALFRTMDQRTEQRKWKTDRLGRRLMDVIGQLEEDLDDKDMPHYYLPGVNLLQGIGDDTVEKMRNRLEHLMQSEQEMMKLLPQ